jgi:hypothetical protein
MERRMGETRYGRATRARSTVGVPMAIAIGLPAAGL